jgi:hypothetical protein
MQVQANLQGAETSGPAEHDVESGLVRAFIVGSIVGFVVTFVLCGGIALACGFSSGASLGVAAYTAVWGGPGFGGMMGAVLRYSRNEIA